MQDAPMQKVAIPPQILPFLPFLISRLPVEAVVNGRQIRLRESVERAVADGDLDLEDAIYFAGIFLSAPVAQRPTLPPSVILVPSDPDEDDAPPTTTALVWPDEVSLTLEWALEPGFAPDGSPSLIGAPVKEENGVIVFDAHPAVINDRTKVRLEAGLLYRGRGLHFSEHPHLAGSIEFVASVHGNIVGTIGGAGTVAPGFPRLDRGVGWGGKPYAETGGTAGMANIKTELKGSEAVELYARCPLSPHKPVSRSLVTRKVV